MMMTLAIGLILMSIALPAMIGAIQGYRLNSIAQQAVGLIDQTRYAAIRRNTTVSLKRAANNGNTVLYVDLNGNGALDANEPMLLVPSDMQIANGQSLTPPATSMGITNTQDFVDTITFDYRGTVNFSGGGATATYVLDFGYSNQLQYGYRAVTTSPMGQTKLWKAGSSGWTGM
jgi:Tfp pilus assembly protein FimT